jgi:hypothetical protein
MSGNLSNDSPSGKLSQERHSGTISRSPTKASIITSEMNGHNKSADQSKKSVDVDNH